MRDNVDCNKARLDCSARGVELSKLQDVSWPWKDCWGKSFQRRLTHAEHDIRTGIQPVQLGRGAHLLTAVLGPTIIVINPDDQCREDGEKDAEADDDDVADSL